MINVVTTSKSPAFTTHKAPGHLPMMLAFIFKHPIIAILGLASCATADVDSEVFEARYTWGHEVNTVQLCGSESIYWVETSTEIYNQLREFHASNTSAPYESVFIRFSGVSAGEASDGFAERYDGVFKIENVTELRRELPGGC